MLVDDDGLPFAMIAPGDALATARTLRRLVEAECRRNAQPVAPAMGRVLAALDQTVTELRNLRNRADQGMHASGTSRNALPANISIEVAARQLGVSESYVRRLCSNRSIEADKVGSVWRISRTDLTRYIEEREESDAG